MSDEFDSTRIADSLIWQVHKFAICTWGVARDPKDSGESIKAAEEWAESIREDLADWLERAKKASESHGVEVPGD